MLNSIEEIEDMIIVNLDDTCDTISVKMMCHI